jgi:hypothetical protein
MSAAAFFLSTLLVAAAAREASVAPQPGQIVQAREELAASAPDVELTRKEFDALVLDRHAMSEIGRGALKHLLRARLLDRLAGESRLVVGEAEIDKKWKELEQSVVAAGEAENLDDYLKKKRVTRAKLREFLRLAIVQERLAGAALGVPAGRTVNGEQQEMWLDQIVQQRGTQLLPPPWKDGIAARCGDLEISLADFLSHLEGPTRERRHPRGLLPGLARQARARAHAGPVGGGLRARAAGRARPPPRSDRERSAIQGPEVRASDHGAGPDARNPAPRSGRGGRGAGANLGRPHPARTDCARSTPTSARTSTSSSARPIRCA